MTKPDPTAAQPKASLVDDDPRRDWPEDQSYMCRCHQCNYQFYGPKRALHCRLCVPVPGAPAAAPCADAVVERDPNVAAVKARMDQREAKGMQTYGVDTTRDDLSTLDWLQHAQDEMLDGSVYLERLKADVRQMAARIAELEEQVRRMTEALEWIADIPGVRLDEAPDVARRALTPPPPSSSGLEHG